MHKLFQVKGITIIWWSAGKSYWRIVRQGEAWSIDMGRLTVDNFARFTCDG